MSSTDENTKQIAEIDTDIRQLVNITGKTSEVANNLEAKISSLQSRLNDTLQEETTSSLSRTMNYRSERNWTRGPHENCSTPL